jgi:hypothetical protein
MQQAGEFDRIRDPEREDREVVVDVVEHAERSSDLRVELTNHAREKDHGKPGTQEHIRKDVRKAPKFGIRNGATRDVNSEDHHNNHELTAQEVPIKVVTLVGNFTALVSGWMGVLEQLSVDGSQTDQGSLTSLHHREPYHRDPKSTEGKARVNISSERGLVGEDQTHNEGDREDKGACRDDILDVVEETVTFAHLVWILFVLHSRKNCETYCVVSVCCPAGTTGKFGYDAGIIFANDPNDSSLALPYNVGKPK